MPSGATPWTFGSSSKPLHLLVISEARSVFHSAATARRPPLNGSSRPAEMVPTDIANERGLNSLGFGPRLGDGQELCGILFRANFLVAQAIDEPLD